MVHEIVAVAVYLTLREFRGENRLAYAAGGKQKQNQVHPEYLVAHV